MCMSAPPPGLYCPSPRSFLSHCSPACLAFLWLAACCALPRLQGELADTQSRLTSSSKEVERLSGELVTANASGAPN